MADGGEDGVGVVASIAFGEVSTAATICLEVPDNPEQVVGIDHHFAGRQFMVTFAASLAGAPCAAIGLSPLSVPKQEAVLRSRSPQSS